MKTLQLLKLCMVTFLTATICTASSLPEDPCGIDDASIVKGNTAFALDLHRTLRTQEGNLFFSPYSISTALAMTYAGARGDTQSQMATTLHFFPDTARLHASFFSLQSQLNAEQEKKQVKISVANGLWVQKDFPFLNTFLDPVTKNYDAVLKAVDFTLAFEKVRNEINAWVEQKTTGRIKDLIQPGVLDPLTRMVLANAIYFKGSWMSRFEERATREDIFRMAPGTKIMVPFMTQQHDFDYMENDTLQMIALPYAGNTLSMIVILPKRVDGLPGLEATLRAENLDSWTALLRKREVRLFLPKFTITSEFSLKHTLAAMGMPDAFTAKADFSGMTGKKDLYINAVVHKAFIDVNEEGTEAAAATAVTMQLLSYSSPPPEFRADHPFLFLIRHNPSGSILFLGRVVAPSG